MAESPAHGADGSEDVQQIVDSAIAENELVLFMKGTPDRPQCGFSQRAVGVLRRHQADFETVNVLGPNLDGFRSALETHSGWETIPQAYAEGEFIGGSDILVELHENGDLDDRLPE